MAIKLPHIEDSKGTIYIPPKGKFELFEDEDHYIEKIRDWGLSNKKEFWYKSRTHQRLVTIKGYEVYGDHTTLVIEFQDGNLSCIHPAYLKEMQSSNFGKELRSQEVSPTQTVAPSKEETVEESNVASKGEVEPDAPKKATSASEKTKAPKQPKKEKAPKLTLPEEKVHFTASVKQMALSWNHFNEENDEVVVLENVRIEGDDAIEVGLAWCSHSKTLKKYELAPGDSLEFDGKIVKKSLPKGRDVEDEALVLDVSVAYKVNNPSKITKK